MFESADEILAVRSIIRHASLIMIGEHKGVLVLKIRFHAVGIGRRKDNINLPESLDDETKC